MQEASSAYLEVKDTGKAVGIWRQAGRIWTCRKQEVGTWRYSA